MMLNHGHSQPCCVHGVYHCIGRRREMNRSNPSCVVHGLRGSSKELLVPRYIAETHDVHVIRGHFLGDLGRHGWILQF